MGNEYKCMACGKFITDDEGVTCFDGSWVCDSDTCRTFDDEANYIINTNKEVSA